MKKFRIITSVLLIAILALIYAAFNGHEEKPQAPAPAEESGGYSGLGK